MSKNLNVTNTSAAAACDDLDRFARRTYPHEDLHFFSGLLGFNSIHNYDQFPWDNYLRDVPRLSFACSSRCIFNYEINIQRQAFWSIRSFIWFRRIRDASHYKFIKPPRTSAPSLSRKAIARQDTPALLVTQFAERIMLLLCDTIRTSARCVCGIRTVRVCQKQSVIKASVQTDKHSFHPWLIGCCVIYALTYTIIIIIIIQVLSSCSAELSWFNILKIFSCRSSKLTITITEFCLYSCRFQCYIRIVHSTQW